jgi:oligopeptide transport system substrate-binding protein
MRMRTLRLAVGVVAAAILVAAAACGGSGGGANNATTSAAETPKRGGSLTLAYQSEPTTLDPAIAWNIIDWQIEHEVFENLYRYAPKTSNLEPAMAASMPQITNGGKTYIIKLKPGIKFQPPVNREVTAQDFKYSFERMMKLPLAPATYFYTGVVGATEYQQGKAAHVSGYKALDKYTIEIDLKAPDLSFLKALTMEFTDPVPKEWVEKWGNKQVGRHPLGTGPFMFASWTPGQLIVLKRNPNYRVQGKPYLDELRFALSYSPETAFLKLQRGEVDILGDELPAPDVPRMMADPNWKNNVYSMNKIAIHYLYMNVQFKPFDNLKVRQALSWAIDRDKQVKLLGGQAKPLYQVYPPGMPGYQPDKRWYGYDPTKAKQLLAEAGYPNGFSTTLYTDNVDPNPKLMQAVQADLAAIGVNVEIKTVSNDTFYTLSATPHKTPCGSYLWSMDFPDPVDWIIPIFSKSNAVEGGMNCSYWWSPTLEKMLSEAQAMTDEQQRIAKFDEMQAYIMSQAPYVTLWSPVMTTMCSKNVGGFYLDPNYNYDPVNYWRK